jgi:exopolysaccharide production protein ExoQ
VTATALTASEIDEDDAIGALQAEEVHANDAPSVWEPWLWGLGVFLLTSPFAYQLTGIDPSAQVERSLSSFRRNSGSGWLLYALRMGVASAAVLMVLPYWRAALGRVRRMGPALLFLCWAILSLMWTDSFTSSLNGIFALLPLLVTGYCLALRLPPHLFARSFVYGTVFMAAFSALYIVALPHFGVHQATDSSQAVHAGNWRGVYPHKNIFGAAAAVGATMIMLAGREVLPSLKLKIGMLAVLLVMIVNSGSATALLIAAVAPMIALGVVALNRAQRLIVLLLLVPTAVAGYVAVGAVFAMLGRDMTFTGRTEIWAYVPEAVARHPITGYGFASTTYGDFMIKIFKEFGLFDPHNGYINLVLSVGLVGLGLFLASLISTGRVARRLYTVDERAGQGGLVMFGVIAAWLISCLSESQDKPLGTFAAFGFTTFGLLVYRHNRPAADQAGVPSAPGNLARSAR